MVKSKKNRPKRIKRTTSKKSKIMYGGADIREKGLAVDIRDIIKLLKDRGNGIPIDPRLTFPPDNINAYGLINQIIHNDDIDSTYGNKPELGDKYISSEQARQIIQAVLDGLSRLTQDAYTRPENFEPSKRNIRFCMEKLRELNKQIVQEDELAKVRDELQRKDAELDSINEEIETLKDEMQRNQAIQVQKNSENNDKIKAQNKKIQDYENEFKRLKNSLDLCNKEKGALQDKLNAYMSKSAAVKPSSPPTTSSSPTTASSSSSTTFSSPTTASAVVLKPVAVKPTSPPAAVIKPAAATNADKSKMEKPQVYSSTPTMVASALNDIVDTPSALNNNLVEKTTSLEELEDIDDEKDLAPSAPPFDLALKRAQEEEEAEEEVSEEEAEVAEIFASVDDRIREYLDSGGIKFNAVCLNNFIEDVEISREFKASLLDIALKESSSNIQKGKLYFDVFTQKVFDELCFYTKYAIDINGKNMLDNYISQKASLAVKTTGLTNRIFPFFFDLIEDVIKYKAAKKPTLRLKILSDYKDTFEIIKIDLADLYSFKMRSMSVQKGSGYIRYLQCLIVVIENFKKFKIDKKLGNTERISEYFNTEKIKLIVKEDEYKLPPCGWFQDIDYYMDDFALYKPEFLKILEGIKHQSSRAVADVLKEDSLIPAIDHLKYLRSKIELHYVKFIFGCALSETDNKAFKTVSLGFGKYVTGVKVFLDQTSSAPDVVSLQKVKTDKEIEYFEELNKLKDACNNINKFVQPSSPESLKAAFQEVEIKKSAEKTEAQPEAQEKTEARGEELTQEQREEKNKIKTTVAIVLKKYANKGEKEEEKASCLYNFIEKGATMMDEIFRSRLLRLALDSSIIGGGEDIDFDKFMENAFDRLCFYTSEFASINQSNDVYLAQKADNFIYPILNLPRLFEDLDKANKISKSLIGKSEEEKNRILTEYDSGDFGVLEYALEQVQDYKTVFMCNDNGVGYYKYLWQLTSVIQQMPGIMQNYPPDKEGNITISDYFKEKLMNAKVGNMKLPMCVWFDDIDRYTRISVAFEPKFQGIIQQIQQECSYNSSDVLKEANLEAKIETIKSLISELENYTIEFVFACALNNEKFKLFKQSYSTLLKYYTNVKKSVGSDATTPDAIATALVNDFSGAQNIYIDGIDLLSKFFIIVIKFVSPVPQAEIVKAMEGMRNQDKKEGGRKRSNRKTKKIRKTVKSVRKTKRKGKK